MTGLDLLKLTLHFLIEYFSFWGMSSDPANPITTREGRTQIMGDNPLVPSRHDLDLFRKMSGSEYYRNPEKALEKLWPKLETLEIKPFSYQESKKSSEDTGEVKKEKINEGVGQEDIESQKSQVAEGVKAEERDSNSPNEERVIINEEVLWLKRISAKAWFQLARWAKVQGHFEPDDRSLLFTIGKKVQFNFKYPPSPSQAKRARKLYEKAERLGFRPE